MISNKVNTIYVSSAVLPRRAILQEQIEYINRPNQMLSLFEFLVSISAL